MTSSTSKQPQVRGAAPSRPSKSNRALVTTLTLATGTLVGACATEAEAIDVESCGAAEVYRIDTIVVPRTNNEAREKAFDLDHDDLFDNQIGMLASTLQGVLGIDLSAAATARANRDVTWQLGVRRCPGGEVAITLGPPDRQPAYLLGEERDGELVVSGASGDLPLATMFDPDATFPGAGWVTSARTELRLVPRPDGGFDGRLGVALPHADAFDAVVEAFAPYMNAHIDDVFQMREQYDDNHDGRITIDEVRDDDFTKAMLSADLKLDGAPHLSFGVGLSARR